MATTKSRATTGLLTAVLLTLSLPAAAQAIKPAADEQDQLKACEKSICSAALTKPSDGDLVCKVQKTWTKSYIENGVRQKKISWTFGDAQCGIDVKLSNADLTAAMTQPKHVVQFEKHTVTCNVERENEVTKIDVDLAPKIEFEGGKAKTAWLNVSDIKAPTIIGTAIWSVAKLEDNFGLFHGEMISEINEFLGEKCPRRYPELVKN